VSGPDPLPDADYPCGLLTLALDGTVVEANGTFLRWVGRDATELGRLRLQELLPVGARIFWETHLSPLLHVERRLEEVALELRVPGGRLPILLSAIVAPDEFARAAVSSAGERLRYERELQAARAAAEHAAARVAALQRATAALSDALGVDAVVAALLDAATGPLGGSAATVWLAGPDGRLGPGTSRGEQDPLPPPAALVLQASGAREARLDGDHVVVALHGQAALRGVLSVAPATDAGAQPPDLDVLGAVGRQGGLALDRARLYEHAAGVARELQHSLLAVDPPADPRYGVGAIYRPGVEMLEVGGDWYDVFLVEPGVLAFVVGDVVGRGLGAASAMGQLRSAVRAVAGPGVGPAPLLERLDRFVDQVEAAALSTLAYAELDLASGLVRYACAGHPPPLMLPSAGGGRLLWDGRSTPLGAHVHGERGEATVQLRPADRMLLYTDGLVERRDRALDDGLDALVDAAVRSRGLPLADAVRAVTQDMLRDEQGRDDVCALLLSWSASEIMVGVQDERRPPTGGRAA
jgi:hypothetical protein